jgi:hypothetical protein|tara:strand:- start:1871 stop:2173 length:303 start_codon:yes stop_codon:yes gene_type:complete
MTKREKTRELFIELINEQLKPHGVTYEDVKGNSEWYMKYRTSLESEEAFISYSIKRIREVLKCSKQMATKETQWFILQWGLALEKTPTKQSTKLKNKKAI